MSAGQTGLKFRVDISCVERKDLTWEYEFLTRTALTRTMTNGYDGISSTGLDIVTPLDTELFNFGIQCSPLKA